MACSEGSLGTHRCLSSVPQLGIGPQPELAKPSQEPGREAFAQGVDRPDTFQGALWCWNYFDGSHAGWPSGLRLGHHSSAAGKAMVVCPVEEATHLGVPLLRPG